MRIVSIHYKRNSPAKQIENLKEYHRIKVYPAVVIKRGNKIHYRRCFISTSTSTRTAQKKRTEHSNFPSVCSCFYESYLI